MIEPVRIGFSTTDALLSRLIRRFTGSRASHAFLVYRDVDFERDMVMEAVGNGFRIVPYDGFERHNTVVALIAPAHSIEQGLRRAVDWLGSGYDTRGLLGMAWVLLVRWLRLRSRGVRLKNPFARSRALFCSEAVARACHWSASPGFDLDPESTTPAGSPRLLRARGGGPALALHRRRVLGPASGRPTGESTLVVAPGIFGGGPVAC